MFATYTISFRQKNNTDHIPIIDHEFFFSTIRFASGNRLARGTLESCWLHPWYNCFVLPIQNTMYFNNSYKYTCNFCLTRSLIGWKKLPFIVWRILTAQSKKKKYQLGHTNILICSSDPARSYLNKTTQITSLLITHMQTDSS